MADKLWKQTERAIAKRLGGARVGPSGKSTADALSRLAYERAHDAALAA